MHCGIWLLFRVSLGSLGRVRYWLFNGGNRAVYGLKRGLCSTAREDDSLKWMLFVSRWASDLFYWDAMIRFNNIIKVKYNTAVLNSTIIVKIIIESVLRDLIRVMIQRLIIFLRHRWRKWEFFWFAIKHGSPNKHHTN